MDIVLVTQLGFRKIVYQLNSQQLIVYLIPKVQALYFSILLVNNTLNKLVIHESAQFSAVAQSCLTLCNPMDCSTPGFPVYHQLPEPMQTHVHWVCDAIHPSHPLSSPSPPGAFNLSQCQGLFKLVSSSYQVAKVLELQLQHESFQWIFQWIFRTDFL